MEPGSSSGESLVKQYPLLNEANIEHWIFHLGPLLPCIVHSIFLTQHSISVLVRVEENEKTYLRKHFKWNVFLQYTYSISSLLFRCVEMLAFGAVGVNFLHEIWSIITFDTHSIFSKHFFSLFEKIVFFIEHKKMIKL